MDVEKIFHMTGGVGDTSYSKNSSLQKKAYDKVKNITLETIEEVYATLKPKSLGIADLGCSSGPNALSNLKEIVNAVEWASTDGGKSPAASLPELRVYLNDLPNNDFNVIFKALPNFYEEIKKGSSIGTKHGSAGPSIFVAGYPGSFYGRIFPQQTLHFIYSSYSLHWLSRVPKGIYDGEGGSINKGCVYICERSPPQVSEAYEKQFKEDLSVFLGARSEELVGGGRMVLILLGRRGLSHFDRGNSLLWEVLTRSLSIFVDEGKIEKEKFDSYEVHFYAPSKDEIEEVVSRSDGSFVIERFEMFEADQQGGEIRNGRKLAMAVRAIQESMMKHHFGESMAVHELFELYGRLLDEEITKQDISPTSFLIVLKKL